MKISFEFDTHNLMEYLDDYHGIIIPEKFLVKAIKKDRVLAGKILSCNWSTFELAMAVVKYFDTDNYYTVHNLKGDHDFRVWFKKCLNEIGGDYLG